MDNPYANPTSQRHSRDTLRSLWWQPLICPACAQTAVAAGKAWLLHPQIRIRCRSCHSRSRVRLEPSVKTGYQLVWALPIAIGALGILVLDQFDPFELMAQMLWRFLPSLCRRTIRTVGWSGLNVLMCASLIMLLVTPILISAWIALRYNLRVITTRAKLVPYAENRRWFGRART